MVNFALFPHTQPAIIPRNQRTTNYIQKQEDQQLYPESKGAAVIARGSDIITRKPTITRRPAITTGEPAKDQLYTVSSIARFQIQPLFTAFIVVMWWMIFFTYVA